MTDSASALDEQLVPGVGNVIVQGQIQSGGSADGRSWNGDADGPQPTDAEPHHGQEQVL